MRFVSFCPPLNRLVTEYMHNSANLHVVILTIISRNIYTIYSICLVLASRGLYCHSSPFTQNLGDLK